MKFLAIILFQILGLNFFYRAILLFYRCNNLTYSEQTKHKFRCENCEKEYYLNGVELKELKKSSVLITKETPTKTVKYFKTNCPLCGSHVNQEKIFDINFKFGGIVNIQMDAIYKPLIRDALLKGVLPLLAFKAVLSIIGLIWFILHGIINFILSFMRF